MSKYGEKHPHEAECAVKTCEETGTTLKVQMGVLDWWCEEHSDLDHRDERTA